MATKISNQITFTEIKKIIKINEYYTITSVPELRGDEVWSTSIPLITQTNRYLWNYEETIYSIGEPERTDPVIIGVYGKDGANGRGISAITNFYATTTDIDIAPSEWSASVPELTPENKYLWNYEYISYTDGSHTTTEAAVIGVYGDSGTDSVSFQIYSVDGFEFSDYLASITLKTAAFQGGSAITSGMTYRWLWWNSGSTLDDKYEVIPNSTSATLQVNMSDPYAFSSLKCEMKYCDITYEDHVSLTKKADVYTAMMKFFNGSNVISSDSDYTVAYVELYKNNEPAELLRSKKIYISETNLVSGGIIDTDFEYDGDSYMYFVCENELDNAIEYDVVLGRYIGQQWVVVESDYTYNNDLFTNSTSHVIFIPKEKVSRSLSINVDVCNNNDIVARSSAIVLDLNDPMVSSTSPSDPKVGQLWLDTSASPSILKMWDGTNWVNSGYQNGNAIYTSQPLNGYSEGDLWILSKDDEDLFGESCEGTMLRSTTTYSGFNKDHWIDVDKDATSQKKNIKQYFMFNADTGLRIGQSDDKFYVNISSTRMSFCENPLVQSSSTNEVVDPNEVVSISNQSAKIKNLTVEDGATFNCEVKLWNFLFTKESNGSLSLSVQ